ncbi:SWF/SNF helicase family protein, partial [Candidatus Sumerlaeota bacterium]|nr:SWF/SNF helicase family protein [Candidatus Sumerlaeota bacterium]
VELLGPIIENGHKTLVFSQFVTMLDLLRTRLEQEGIPFHYLTGQSTNRGELVSKFEHDPRPCVFLISLKAGGTGLNLVSASHVVIFDPWWNPAVEAQAIDRTHRIGQDKTVIACRLVTEGTIEERILELQERKRTLIRGVLEEESFNRMLTRDDFEFLLSEGSAEPDLEEIPLASA